MNNEQKDVDIWHNRFHVLRNLVPTNLDEKTIELRIALIQEEFDELKKHMRSIFTWDIDQLTHVADDLGDLLYVIYGTAVSYGIDMEPIFAEIHRSNMSKGDPEVLKASNGKILKSRNWTPPNLKPILEHLGFKGKRE